MWGMVSANLLLPTAQMSSDMDLSFTIFYLIHLLGSSITYFIQIHYLQGKMHNYFKAETILMQ